MFVYICKKQRRELAALLRIPKSTTEKSFSRDKSHFHI